MNLFGQEGAALRPMRMVSLDVASAVLNLSCRALAARVDSGNPLWVFNLSLGAGRRQMYRFWAVELVDPDAVRRARLADVVERIIGVQRPRLRCREVEMRLGVSDTYLRALLSSGRVKCSREANYDLVWRETLRAFLQASWLGNVEKQAE